MNENNSIVPSLEELRRRKPAHKKVQWEGRTFGERMADKTADWVGSWQFIVTQSALLALWIVVNVLAWRNAWDPYPFILLNLVLSFQAAFTAPIIMMSQNRQDVIDRHRAEIDYMVNVKAELEIELLHQKIDALREQEIKSLIDIISDMQKKMGEREHAAHPATPA